MKTVAQQYRETLREAKHCKPRSERKAILTGRLVNLMARQLRIESRRVPRSQETREIA